MSYSYIFQRTDGFLFKDNTVALNYVHTVQLGPIAISEDRWVPTVKDNSSERYTVQLGPIAISEDRWVPTVKDNSSEV